MDHGNDTRLEVTSRPAHLFGPLVLLLILGVIAVCAFRISREAVQQRVTLSDGTTIEFLGISAGNATFTTETTWQKTARKHMPPRFTRWLPTPVSGNCGYDSNSVTVFLRVGVPPGTLPDHRPWKGYRTKDEVGFCYPRDGGYCSFGSGTPGGLVYGLTLRSFPRRPAKFTFELLDEKENVIASFLLTNPSGRTFPEWSPEPVPQTKTNGPVVLTLSSLANEGQHLRPEWNLTSTSTAWAKTRPRYYSVQDPTGNTGRMLSPREKTWKLTTLVYRDRPEHFAPDEKLILTNLALPGPAQMLELDQRVTLGIFSLNIQALCGPGDVVVSNRTHRTIVPLTARSGGHSSSSHADGTRVDSWSSSKHFLLLELNGAVDNDELQLEVTDDQGRAVNTKDGGYYGQGGARVYLREFMPEPNAMSLSIEARVSRPLLFEFLIAPPHPPANLPQSN